MECRGRAEISARLKGPTNPAELAFDGYREVLASARSQRASLLKSARNRARLHSKKIRLAAIDDGYRDGLKRGTDACDTVISSIRGQYRAALSIARLDAAMVAEKIVASIVEEWLQQNPGTLDAWISLALNHVGDARPLVLRYHPRYLDFIGSTAHSCDPLIRLEMDPNLGEVDLSLETPKGGVSFSWREVLQSLFSLHGPSATPVDIDR